MILTWIQASHIEEKFFVAANVYMAVATKFHYEKVRRTMGTGIASYLFNVQEKKVSLLSRMTILG